MSTKVAETAQEKADRIVRRNANIQTNKAYHARLFAALGVQNPYYDNRSLQFGRPKEPYFLPENRIGFFQSVLDRSDDIYFELTNYDCSIPNTPRALYKLKGNPHYKSETDTYDYRANTQAGAQYYVALESCELVEFPVHSMSENLQQTLNDLHNTVDDFVLPVAKEDMSMEKLTARDHVCITLKVPDSSQEWINELIRKSI